MVIECDVLVVGSGGAGLRAAIAAKEENPECEVCIADKGVLGAGGATATGYSDRMAFHATLEHTEPRNGEAWKYHANDIYAIGGEVSDPVLACMLALKSREAYEYLESIGVPFVKKNGVPDQFITDGSDFARACYTGPKTAVDIYERLLAKSKDMDIAVLNRCFIFKLLQADGRIIGALGLMKEKDSEEESPVGILAKSIIIATGGGGNVYKNSVFTKIMTGDGLAIAFDVGCELINLEFIQIGLGISELLFGCAGSLFRSLPRVLNDRGEEFLPVYYKNKNEYIDNLFLKGSNWPISYEKWLTTQIDVACTYQNKRGKKVYLDYARNPSGFSFDLLSENLTQRYRREITNSLGDEMRKKSPLNRLREINPVLIEWLREHGIDLESGAKIEITPCVQHFQGGIKINRRAETNISGLFAAGECAGGQHGANRPGGNSLLDCQVFGKIAGVGAAKFSQKNWSKDKYMRVLTKIMQDLFSDFTSTPKAEDNRFIAEIQKIMTDEAGVIRSPEGLAKAMEKLAEIEKEQDSPAARARGLNKNTIRTKLVLTTARLILTACLNRKESRGPHLFFDHEIVIPSGQNWRKAFCLSKGDNRSIKIEPIEYEKMNLRGVKL